MMDWRQWDPPPVGVHRLNGLDMAANLRADLRTYKGISYCDAVRRAGEGETLLVTPESIKVCHWSPVVLGFKDPQGSFEQGLEPRFDYPNAGLLLAPLDAFPGEPEVVIVRASRDRIKAMMAAVGKNGVWQGHDAELDLSAIPVLEADTHRVRQWLVGSVNRLLAGLARWSAWRKLTHLLFRSRTVTRIFEALISRTLVDMSVCRNSTVIPTLEGKANASFFCTGGITWGLNQSEQMTSGWPWVLFQQAVQAPQGDGSS